MYWDIGRMIAARQKEEGWGTGVIPRLAADLKNELPEEKGFSERNIKRMLRFYTEYSALPSKVPQPAALLENADHETTVKMPQSVAQSGSAGLPSSSQLFFFPIVQRSVALGAQCAVGETTPELCRRLFARPVGRRPPRGREGRANIL